ncbi:ROK family transcriptional regulator [Rhizobiaceae bacterium n13]|uniref:ROK family transcriptional regulator n=1 Tax=Ferirhizobium litorale TaxID=2927786 RepID=A0AAE3QC42_9HYPH|nr:ROK family transcriptional regulator [Fererhizobium litorale]MDI7860752.1 ROK family transcriptional regulator [Fererhizobium litorale]MDI7920900.1 ROK family transcriptional regulator [Fererhizobium litorale]
MLTKSSTELVRQQNSVLVLSALRRHGRLAHTEISDFTRLSSATVSAITADLEKAQIIVRTENQALSGRGRPRVLFEQRRDCGFLIVVIISSDALQFSLVDYAGRLLDRFSEARPPALSIAASFLEAIRLGLERVIARAGLSRQQVKLISISSKGLVNQEQAELVWSPVLGEQRVDFAGALKAEWSAKILLNNETLLVAAALGERAEKDGTEAFRSLAALSLGHSIGLGIVRRTSAGGQKAIASNFGHMLHVPGGALCRCGARGCVEAYSGFYAILRAAFEVPQDTIPAKFVPIGELDKIAASARQGNRNAIFAFRQSAQALGIGLSRMLSLHERMPIVVTGPGTRYFDLLRVGMGEGLLQSQTVRLEGMPVLSVVADEQGLVFEGHLNRALAIIDQDVVGAMGSGFTATM